MLLVDFTVFIAFTALTTFIAFIAFMAGMAFMHFMDFMALGDFMAGMAFMDFMAGMAFMHFMDFMAFGGGSDGPGLVSSFRAPRALPRPLPRPRPCPLPRLGSPESSFHLPSIAAACDLGLRGGGFFSTWSLSGNWGWLVSAAAVGVVSTIDWVAAGILVASEALDGFAPDTWEEAAASAAGASAFIISAKDPTP